MNKRAPILLFTYKRLETLKLTVEALKLNKYSDESDLFIFSDAPKNEHDEGAINDVRSFLESINGFKSIIIEYAKENKGLANSIIDGISKTLEKHESVIVLEDDLVTSSNFLSFMNSCLDYYEDRSEIFSIAGYSPNIPNPTDDIYFTKRASSWGWATWKDRWEKIDWDVVDYDEFKKNRRKRLDFNQMGTDMSKMLDNQMSGKINSWAIRWTYHQFNTKSYTVYPTISKVINIGTDDNATNTIDYYNRFYTKLDERNKHIFNFERELKLEKKYLKKFLNQYSYYTRIKYKLLNTLSRIVK